MKVTFSTLLISFAVFAAIAFVIYKQFPFKKDMLLGKYANLDCVNECGVGCEKITNEKDKQMCYNDCMTKCSQL